MQLKKHCAGQHGYERIITDRNSPLCFLEVDMVKLSDKEACLVDEPGKEFALIVLDGRCAVSGKGFSFPSVGRRRTVFDGPAEAVYVGKDTPFEIRAESDVRVCLAKAPAAKPFPPQYVTADAVATKTLGKGPYTREAAFNVAENVRANLLYIGEFWVSDGGWASYPPHKHDVEHMPAESFSDEVYYFEFEPGDGFGVQMVYADGLDEAYRVETGDFVEIPKGYHPFTVAPGYKNYCLWMMAGRNRGIFCTTDPRHAHLK